MAKRKADDTPSQAQPRKKPSITKKDPLRVLPFDCASLILEHLDLQTLTRCEQVDSGWRAFTHLWISILGLRLHFPDSWTPGIGNDAQKAIRLFKQRVIPELTLRTAQASGFRKVIADERFFTIAGDLAAWKHEDGINWQDLRYRDKSSFHPVQKLPFALGERLINLVLNEDGYLLVRTQPLGFRDHLFFLPTGKELWACDIPQASSIDHLGYLCSRPIAIGRERVYYASRGHVTALSSHTGAQLWTARLTRDRNTWYETSFNIAPRESQRLLSRNFTTLLQLNGKEVLVGLEYDTSECFAGHGSYPTRAHGLSVVSGSDGGLIQRIGFDGERDISYIQVSKDKSAFCVVDIYSNGLLRINKYGPQNGLFKERDCDLLHLTDLPRNFHDCGEYCTGLDPYRQVFGRVYRGLALKMGPYASGPAAGPRDELRKRPMTGGSVFHDGPSHQVALNTGTERLHLFEPDTRATDDFHWVHFVDRDRVVLEVARRIKRPSWSQALRPMYPQREFYVFEFGRDTGLG